MILTTNLSKKNEKIIFWHHFLYPNLSLKSICLIILLLTQSVVGG